jgi:hypothetical protein
MLDTHRPGSQFWNFIQKLKYLLCLGAKHSVLDGKATSFGREWWQGSGPLCDRFPMLLSIAANQDLLVVSAHHGEAWHLPLRRELGPGDRAAWANLLREVVVPPSSALPYKVTWAFESSGRFSVHSLYLNFFRVPLNISLTYGGSRFP